MIDLPIMRNHQSSPPSPSPDSIFKRDALAYNLANFFRTLVLPDKVERWSLTTLREKVVKIGAKVISHARYTVFQMAEVAVPRDLFCRILALIDDLRPRQVARC